MRKILYVLLMATAAAIPANAGITPVWVTCDFVREGEPYSDHLGMWTSDRAELVINGHELGHVENTMTVRVDDTIHVFNTEEWPYRWRWAINMDTMEGLSFSEGIPIRSTSCRGGAE